MLRDAADTLMEVHSAGVQFLRPRWGKRRVGRESGESEQSPRLSPTQGALAKLWCQDNNKGQERLRTIDTQNVVVFES